MSNTKQADTKTTGSVTSSEKKTVAAPVRTDGAAAVSGKYADADVVQIGDTQWRIYYATQPEGATWRFIRRCPRMERVGRKN